MSDRFKFRVWSIEDNVYLEPDFYGFFWMTADGEIQVGNIVWDGFNCVYQEVPQEKLIVEQCTGLKDKNGRLIYEGDIVCYDDTPYNGYATKTKGVVAYRKAEFCYRYSDCCGGLYQPLVPHDDFWQRKTEIIGNVHEIAGNIHETEVEA